MKNINDEVFGELKVNDLGWEKSYCISMWNEKFIITLSIDGEDEISEMQKLSFKKFEREKDRYLNLVEEELFNYYSNNLKEIRAYIESEEWEAKAPIINSKYDLKKLVKPHGIIIPEDIEEEIMTLGILFDCSWVGEHTFVIRFDNDEITMGTEEIIY